MKNFFSLTLILVIGLAAWTTFMAYHPETLVSSKKNTLPDAFMENVTALMMNKEGMPSLKIVTPKLTHYTDNDTSNFLTPKLTIYRQSPEPWYITSQYGKSTQGMTNVFFWQHVNIQHAADVSSPETLIKTPTLLVHPNDRTAETKDWITLIQPNTTIKAVGMQANMKTGDIKLLSQVRGEYVPDA
jgi:lipopolysaccharide export system protein LptC